MVMQGLEITPTTVFGTIEFITDCNLNGVPDGDDISGGSSVDCDGDGVPDECGFDPALPDCNNDGIPDICESDCNGDLIADPCQPSLDCDGDGVLAASDMAP